MQVLPGAHEGNVVVYRYSYGGLRLVHPLDLSASKGGVIHAKKAQLLAGLAGSQP